MKKVILFFAILSISSLVTVFAEVTRVQSGNGVEVEWKFKPEVSTHAGYNMDWGQFGMEGKAKLTLTSQIRSSSTEEFVSEDADTVYAKIEVTGLEIKFQVAGPQGLGRDDDELDKKTTKVTGTDGKEHEVLTKETKTKGKQGVRVKWSNINATVYMGPAYVQLKSKAHETVNYVSSLSDMDFGTVKQDLVTPLDTARSQSKYKYTVKEEEKMVEKSGDFFEKDAMSSKKALSYEDSDVNNADMNKQLAALKVGFKLDKVVDVSVGFSTKYSYRESLETVSGSGDKAPFNPFALSLDANVLAVENLTLKLRNSYVFSKVTKDGELKFLGEGNPLSFGTVVGYKLNMGESFFVKPSVKFDLAMENKAPYGKTPPVEPKERSKDDVFTASYEAGAGLVFGFQNASQYAVKSKSATLFGDTTKVMDGVGLGFFYGSTPYEKVRKLNVPYVGMKLSVWDSESGDVVGWLPGFQHGLVFNFNYALGAKQTVDDVEYDLKPTADVGLGYDAAYTFAFLKFKAGTLFKAFNVTNQDGGSAGETQLKRVEKNPFDLRLKLGVDVVKVVPNTTFEFMWESGDLLRTKDSKKQAEEYHKAENFYSVKGTNAAESKAQFGYVSAGIKVAF